MLRQSSVRTIPRQTRFTRIGASSITSARVTASTAPQIAEAITHPLDSLLPNLDNRAIAFGDKRGIQLLKLLARLWPVDLALVLVFLNCARKRLLLLKRNRYLGRSVSED
jgi:hypothetical protein